ncbi:MAG: glycosyltransferase family 2 protein [Paludibacter sp.]|nr:glycosyltransferase family 2 protein [Paludibacter sp.]
MFSVIIPLYNKEKYIEKALQSVINQTFKEFEVIVIDDGSIDNSLAIVNRFKNEYSNITILEQANSGVSTARNNAVKVAKYDYIAFLDADDWWEENYLETIKRLIDDFPEGALFASSYFKVKNRRYIAAKIGVNQDFTRGYFDYLQAYISSPYMPVWTGAAVVKKSIFDEFNGFNPALKMGEDFDLWVRIALKYKIVLENQPLAFYNQDVEQASRAVGRKIHKPENHFLFALPQLYEQEKDNPKLKQVLDNLRVYGLFPYFLNNATRTAALKELKKVDWEKQPASEFNKYFKTSIFVSKNKMRILSILSDIKTKILKK